MKLKVSLEAICLFFFHLSFHKIILISNNLLTFKKLLKSLIINFRKFNANEFYSHAINGNIFFFCRFLRQAAVEISISAHCIYSSCFSIKNFRLVIHLISSYRSLPFEAVTVLSVFQDNSIALFFANNLFYFYFLPSAQWDALSGDIFYSSEFFLDKEAIRLTRKVLLFIVELQYEHRL